MRILEFNLIDFFGTTSIFIIKLNTSIFTILKNPGMSSWILGLHLRNLFFSDPKKPRFF